MDICNDFSASVSVTSRPQTPNTLQEENKQRMEEVLKSLEEINPLWSTALEFLDEISDTPSLSFVDPSDFTRIVCIAENFVSQKRDIFCNEVSFQGETSELQQIIRLLNQKWRDFQKDNYISDEDKKRIDGEFSRVDSFCESVLLSCDEPCENKRQFNLNTVDKKTKIDFSKMIYLNSRLQSYFSRDLPQKYRDDNYRYKTVGEYIEEKKYPSKDIDLRPANFDPKGDDICAHGTNFETVLKAVLNTNMQLVPSIKHNKLMGTIPTTGENKGVLPLNRKYVSTVSLTSISSTYLDTIRYATWSAGRFGTSLTVESKIPVVIIGDGVKLHYVKSSISNEVGYKRVNIRILAFKDKNDMECAGKLLNEILKKSGNKEICGIRLCTFSDLKTNKEIPIEFREPPDIEGLWNTAVPVGVLASSS